MPATLLDKENFTISTKGRKLQDIEGILHGQKVSLKVKVNPEGDVWEYVSGVPSEFIGQQFFTYHAALRETQKLGKSLPEDQSALETIIATMSGDTQHQQYMNYLSQASVQFSGCFSSGSHIFDDIGDWSYYRLADGSRVALSHTTRNVARRDESMGYMVSLDK